MPVDNVVTALPATVIPTGVDGNTLPNASQYPPPSVAVSNNQHSDNAPKRSQHSTALDGQYELHDTIGTGGFAKVKLATHLVTGEKVAI